MPHLYEYDPDRGEVWINRTLQIMRETGVSVKEALDIVEQEKIEEVEAEELEEKIQAQLAEKRGVPVLKNSETPEQAAENRMRKVDVFLDNTLWEVKVVVVREQLSALLETRTEFFEWLPSQCAYPHLLRAYMELRDEDADYLLGTLTSPNANLRSLLMTHPSARAEFKRTSAEVTAALDRVKALTWDLAACLASGELTVQQLIELMPLEARQHKEMESLEEVQRRLEEQGLGHNFMDDVPFFRAEDWRDFFLNSSKDLMHLLNRSQLEWIVGESRQISADSINVPPPDDLMEQWLVKEEEGNNGRLGDEDEDEDEEDEEEEEEEEERKEGEVVKAELVRDGENEADFAPHEEAGMGWLEVDEGREEQEVLHLVGKDLALGDDPSGAVLEEVLQPKHDEYYVDEDEDEEHDDGEGARARENEDEDEDEDEEYEDEEDYEDEHENEDERRYVEEQDADDDAGGFERESNFVERREEGSQGRRKLKSIGSDEEYKFEDELHPNVRRLAELEDTKRRMGAHVDLDEGVEVAREDEEDEEDEEGPRFDAEEEEDDEGNPNDVVDASPFFQTDHLDAFSKGLHEVKSDLTQDELLRVSPIMRHHPTTEPLPKVNLSVVPSYHSSVQEHLREPEARKQSDLAALMSSLMVGGAQPAEADAGQANFDAAEDARKAYEKYLSERLADGGKDDAGDKRP